MKKIDLYDYPRRLRSSLKRLKEDKLISGQDKEDIGSFSNAQLAKGSSHGRVAKAVYCMHRLSEWLGKPFREATKDDLIKLVGSIESKDYADYTKYEFKVILKMYYKWLKGNEEVAPPEIKWLIPKIKNEKNKLLIVTAVFHVWYVLYRTASTVSECVA